MGRAGRGSVDAAVEASAREARARRARHVARRPSMRPADLGRGLLRWATASRWRHHLGLLDAEPVATSALFVGAGVAGLSFVFTAEEARWRGIGAALTLAPLLEARTIGLSPGVLQSSTMGEPVYRRLGFAEHCRISIYEWCSGATS